MNELIRYFNGKYGKKYGKIAYPRTTVQIYQTYQIIKDCNIEDNELNKLLDEAILPKPKTIEEMEMYSECINNKEQGFSEDEIYELLPCYIRKKIKVTITKEELENCPTINLSDGIVKYININKNLELKTGSIYKVNFDNQELNLEYSENEVPSFSCRYGKQDEMGRFTVEIQIMPNSRIVSENESSFNSIPDRNTTAIKIEAPRNFELSNMIIFEEEFKKIDSKFFPESMENITVGSRMDGESIGEYSSAFGDSITASGTGSHAEGLSSRATGDYSHAEGYGAKANGRCSHAEGQSAEANGDYSHAEGYYTEANSDYSHAEGYNSIASGDYSHAEGFIAKATGNYSHAEGQGTEATGDYTHAEGRGTKASGSCSHVQGKYNIEDTENKYAHIVGGGEDTYTRSNIHTLDWTGNAWYKNEVYVGGKNKDDGKKLLSTKDIYFNPNGELVVTVDGVTKKFTPKA